MMPYENITQLVSKYQQDQRLAWAVTAIFALLLCYSFWQFIQVFTKYNQPTLEETRPLPIIQPTANVAQWHLFGSYISNIESLPEAQLNITVVGIFYASNPDNSQVLLSSAGAPAKVFKLHQTIPGGAKIKEILQDTIVLEQNGKLQKLRLKVPNLQFAPLPQGNILKEQNP